MNCRECLAELETGSLRDLTPDSPVYAHAATCPDCSRVTTLLRDREYEAATFLNELPPLSNPVAVADNAISLSKRRRLGKIVTMFTGGALVATIWIAAYTTFIPMMNRADASHANLRTETIQLRCLSPEQAGDIINPYVRSNGSTYYVPSSGLSAITVRGRPSEIAKSRELIAEFETDPSAACRVPGSGLNGPADLVGAPVLAGDKAPVPAKIR